MTGKIVSRWVGHYLKIPYKERGMLRDGICDWGLIRLIMSEQFNIAVSSMHNLPDFDTEVAAYIRMHFRQIPEPEVGDLVIGKGNIFGLVVGNENFITVERNKKPCLMKLEPEMEYFRYVSSYDESY